MDTSTDMMRTMSMPAGIEMMAMQQAIDAGAMCMQTCTMCSDAMSGMDGMGSCASQCAMCAEVCGTTTTMMLRPSAMDMAAMHAMLEACVAMCAACAAECRMHDSESCAMCADACEKCESACRGMLAAMSA